MHRQPIFCSSKVSTLQFRRKKSLVGNYLRAVRRAAITMQLFGDAIAK
jgi:hypothetical protein